MLSLGSAIGLVTAPVPNEPVPFGTYFEKNEASAARQGRRSAGSSVTWAWAGTSCHFTV